MAAGRHVLRSRLDRPARFSPGRAVGGWWWGLIPTFFPFFGIYANLAQGPPRPCFSRAAGVVGGGPGGLTFFFPLFRDLRESWYKDGHPVILNGFLRISGFFTAPLPRRRPQRTRPQARAPPAPNRWPPCARRLHRPVQPLRSARLRPAPPPQSGSRQVCRAGRLFSSPAAGGPGRGGGPRGEFAVCRETSGRGVPCRVILSFFY